MPDKYPEKKGWWLSKQKYKINNWHDYNQAPHDEGCELTWVEWINHLYHLNHLRVMHEQGSVLFLEHDTTLRAAIDAMKEVMKKNQHVDAKNFLTFELFYALAA